MGFWGFGVCCFCWYHFVVAFDSTQATGSNRIKFYVNGVEATGITRPGDVPLNTNFAVLNASQVVNIGRHTTVNRTFDGYLAEFNIIDGQALTPSSFGETNATTGSWVPKAYTGTYGNKGVYLNFSDIATTSGSNAGLGKDFSGNANYWTTNNISVTAGTTYDAMTDVPTNTSATVANYAVLNLLKQGSAVTVSNGNLRAVGTGAAWGTVLSSIGMTSGKWYCEITVTANSNSQMFGICQETATLTTYVGASAVGYGYYAGGEKYNNGVNALYGASYTANDVIGIAYDADIGSLTFYKNNSSQGVAYSGLSTTATWFFAVSAYNTTNTNDINFGQRPFSYTPPSGFVALNTYNLPTPTILQGNKYMDATLYTGTGASLAITNAGAFKPDLVWVKGRSGATDHALYDSVRGTTKQLESNTNTAETTEATGLTAFGTGGFTVGALAQMNTSAATYVGWQWQGGQSSGVSNTSGTITSTVSASTTAGFSVFTYTGNATANATIGHGLGVAPKMFIVKCRSTTGEGLIYHVSTGKDGFMQLFNTDAFGSSANYWGSTGPTSTTIQINGGGGVNNSGGTYVVWCWAEIAGFSKFGSYTGNGSADGPFVYTGFRPKYVLVKRSDSTGSWVCWDSSRGSYNLNNADLYPDLNIAEYASPTDNIDMLSNGFKLRATGTGTNASGGTFIYAAYAENPFKNSNAR